MRLTFDEFFDLMTLKITYQRKLMSSQTVYESKAENVTCILWPSFKEQRHVALSSQNSSRSSSRREEAKQE